ncbi:MAG: hypothetical protein WC895_04455 [Candidatus Shapirobacteria bacterium]|jgi:hypothetical protein
MAHSIKLVNTDKLEKHLSKQEICDLVDVLYRWRDSAFVILETNTPHIKGSRGVHMYDPITKAHTIQLCYENIIKSLNRGHSIGGNKKAKDAKIAIAFVIAHELQHANQDEMHRPNEIFYTKKKYSKRACEQEARLFVDNNENVILNVLGYDSNVRERSNVVDKVDTLNELQTIAECFIECLEVDVKDIVEELRSSGLNNSKNVTYVRKMLEESGVIVKPV